MTKVPEARPAAPASTAPKRSGRWRRGIAGILLLGAAIAAMSWWQNRSAKAVSYLTQPADHGAVALTISATGTVNPVLTVTVGSYVSGVVDEVLCDFNDTVTQGQVCARIDDRTFQSAVTQAKANLDLARAQLAKDRANLEYAKASYERNQRMAQSKTISQDAADLAKSIYDQAQAQIQVDQATIEQRQAVLGAAKINLDYTEITSPVSGTVILRNVTAGQTVAASLQTPTLFLIAQDLTQMQVDANVSESDIGKVKAGEDASFTVNAFPGRTFTGKVSQVRLAPQSVQNVITYDVRVAVANPDLALKPGMTASVQIVVDARKDTLRVPSKALRYQPSNAATLTAAETNGSVTAHPSSQEPSRTAGFGSGSGRVWILRDGEPQPVIVHTGLDDGSWTEITGGSLAVGDKVILGESSAANGRISTGRSSSPTGIRLR